MSIVSKESIFKKANLGDPDMRMFVGTLDDSVSRYPWQGMSPDLRYLNRLLIYHALIGPRLCVRSGNILFHEPYRLALFDRKKSPLMALAQAGFLQLQMNGDTINESIANRLATQTESAMMFQRATDWAPGSATYRLLEEVDADLEPNVGKLTYTPDFRKHFHAVMADLRAYSVPAFKQVYDQWTKSPAEQLTRNNFEAIARATHANDRIALAQAMRVVNAANHYAYGTGMTAHAENAIIETSSIGILEHRASTPLGPNGRVVENGRFLSLIRLGAFDAIQKKLRLPVALFREPEAWEKFAAAYGDRSSEGGSRISRYKRSIWNQLSLIMDMQEGIALTNAKQRLEDTCEGYSRLIFESVGEKYRENVVMMSVRFIGRGIAEHGFEDAMDKVHDVLIEGSTNLGLPIPKFAARWFWRTVLSIGTEDADRVFDREFDSYHTDDSEHREGASVYPRIEDIAGQFNFPSIKVISRPVPRGPAK